MPKFLIERDIPNVGNLSSAELTGVARKSNSVLRDMEPSIQ
jgi:hypothetical protein